MKRFHFIAALALFASTLSLSAEKMKALIVDGQNNHAVWPKSTVIMKTYLEETGMFTVDVARVRYLWKAEREKDWLDLVETGETEIETACRPVAVREDQRDRLHAGLTREQITAELFDQPRGAGFDQCELVGLGRQFAQ